MAAECLCFINSVQVRLIFYLNLYQSVRTDTYLRGVKPIPLTGLRKPIFSHYLLAAAFLALAAAGFAFALVFCMGCFGLADTVACAL